VRYGILVRVSVNPELRSGDTGGVVEYLQTLIANPQYGLGFGAVTGVFEESTVAAVMELQRRHYLPQTSVVDSATWDMLEGRTTDQATPSDNRYLQYGDRGDGVEYLQRLLASPVYGIGHGDITVEFDDATLAAVRDFQQRHHLTPTGSSTLRRGMHSKASLQRILQRRS
jgi:peptidoglycan hydrolase-like protein with peptidoglycan-binding domain